jgi:glycosyltransferase involved in cell wall biosynthesis
MRWLVSQEGSRETYAIPLAFHRLDELRLFYVDTWCGRGHSILRRGPKACRALATHFTPGLPPERVVSFSASVLLGRARFYFQKQHLAPQALGDEYCRFGEQFAGLVRDHVRRQELSPDEDHFFGFNTNCLETLDYLRSNGIFTVVDQVDPGKVEEDLCAEEAERWPGWSKAPGRMPQGYWDRLKAEWDTADLVLVNSEWSAKALEAQGVPKAKIITIPLAIDCQKSYANEPVTSGGTLRVLWLGSVILRKGIQYLIEAARLLRKQDIEFWLAGPIGVSPEAVRSFPDNVRLLGRLTRDQLDNVYRQAHVFVLPTLSDGFAITQLEAMAHGLPVIATPNCGRVVTDGEDGFIVPAGDSETLAERLAQLAANPSLVEAMSAKARETVVHYDLPSNARLIDSEVLRFRMNAKACHSFRYNLNPNTVKI